MNPQTFFLYKEAFLRLLFPASCAVCRAFLELAEKNLCSACRQNLNRLKYSFSDAQLNLRLSPIQNTWALFPYKSPVRDLLMAIKYFEKRWAMEVFKDEIRDLALSISSETAYDAVIPIPLTRSKLLERKYNQSELIALFFSVWTRIPTYRSILRRSGLRPSQSQLSFEERQLNPKGVFRAAKPQWIQGKNLLLIDDIITTGATAREAAETLNRAGAKRVDLLTLAHTEL